MSARIRGVSSASQRSFGLDVGATHTFDVCTHSLACCRDVVFGVVVRVAGKLVIILAGLIAIAGSRALLIFHPKLLSLLLKNSVPHDSRVVLFSLLRFSKGRRWRGLQDFVWLRQILPKQRGARFVKVMGCGKGAVFSVTPDWGRYAFLTVWDSEKDAAEAFQHPRWQHAQAGAESSIHLRLQPVGSHGKWDGGDPFQPLQPTAQSERMAVLTRADVKWWKIRSFSKHAAATSAAVAGHKGLQFSLGMGEWPFVRQATFSIWSGEEAMKAYAYKNATHIAAMRGKNKERWYGEELYARFAVLAESTICVQDLLTPSAS